jgi:hypothetical protein
MRLLLFRCCLISFAVASAFGQEIRATISGTVTDPTGAVVTGAKAVALSVERNVPYEAVTNSAGRYVIQFLPAGKYTLTVDSPGFKQYIREGVELLASDKAAIDVTLELGSSADSVTVSGEVSQLQSETATRQGTIENRIVEQVPSGGRNLYALEYNEPGVLKTSTYWGSMELYAFGNVNGVAISGGVSGENETVLDGLTNTKSDRGVAFVPNLAATQEFTVQTNSYDSQFGRVGGGVMMINLKSGTNELHGQLYEFFKNDKFRAGEWNDNANGLEKTPFKNNTFGFEVDGPVRIPKVFDGRNKLFFLLSLEGLREHNPGSQINTTLPTPAELSGDFSKTLTNAGAQVQIYDPLTTVLGPDGKTYQRTQFPNNVIPATRINPVAAKVASYLPAPNKPGVGLAQLSNYAKILPSTNQYDSWLGKMDYFISEKSRLSFHYGQTPWLNYSKLVWGNNPAEPSTEWPSTRIPRTWAADWNYSVTPHMVFDLRAGLARYEGQGGNTFGYTFDPTQLGLPTSLVSQFRRGVFPYFSIANYQQIGSSSVFSYGTQDAYTLQPSLSWNYGRHLLHFGTELRRYNDTSTSPGVASGEYDFTTAFTQANPLQSAAGSGNGFASFLLGYPSGGHVDNNVSPYFRSAYYALFVQDDFKVSSKLTLNLGLRWDYETPRWERHNQMIGGFAFNQASPIAAAVKGSTAAANCPACQAGLTGGLLFAGSGGLSNYAFEPKKGDFQPRIGVAYRMLPKLVFRGGYALSYLGQSANGPQTGYSQSTSLVSSLDGGLTPAATLSDPYPGSIFPTGLLKPVGNANGLSTNLGQSISFQYRDRPLPYSQQYSAGFQYELPHGWLLDASYVGNQTKDLPVSLNLNFIPTAALTSLPVDQRSAYFNQQLPNPMAGLLPGSGLNAATLTRAQLLYAYPQYSAVTETNVPIGSQRYDGLQTKVTHRFAQGFTATASLTMSKTLQRLNVLNNQDVNLSDVLSTPLEQHLTQYDAPRQLSIIGSWDLPFGRTRQYAHNMNKFVDAILGGWTASGAYNSHSGYPFPFPNAAPLKAGTAKWTDAQRNAYAQAHGDPQFDVTNDPYFNTAMFPTTAQAPYTLRNFPTWFPDVRTKPLNVFDVSLMKEFTITESARLQFRCDGYNVANFPWFSKATNSYTSNVTNSQFGFLENDEENEQRIVVFVMKIVF